MRDLLEVVVPLRWSGIPWADGSVPLSWLAEDGSEWVPEVATTDAPEEAVRLRFRAPTMRDTIKIEMALDDHTGGPAETQDLETAHSDLQALLLARYEVELWPDGRPTAETQEEQREQTAQLNARLFSDDSREVRAYRRISDMLHRAKVLAEMSALIEEPISWRTWGQREIDGPDAQNILTAMRDAYVRARDARNANRGKGWRSGR